MPLISYEFHLVTLISPISTLFLLPLLFALLASGVLLVAFGWISTSVGTLLAIVPDALARLLAWAVQGFAHVPGGHLYIPGLPLGWLLVCYALLAAWAWRGQLGLSRRRLGLAALAAAGVFVWTTGHAAPESPRATFLAVGSANCNLLELSSGHVILYDTGSSLSSSRAAESMIAPALWSHGIDRIDAVFFSHPHFDHFKDILPLADRFRLAKVYVPPTFMRKRMRCDDAVVEALMARGIAVEYFSSGDRLQGAGDVEIRGVWPRGPASMVKSINEGSLVLAITRGNRCLLLTGDLEAGGLGMLRDLEPTLRADAMLWPHHGANTEAVGRYCRASGVRTVVLSAGRTLPPRPPPAWVAEQGVAFYQTGVDGAVTVDLRPEGVVVETFCPRESAVANPDEEENPLDPDHEVVGVDDLIVRPFAENLGELAGLEALDLIDIF
jgi:competence protein ComEC